MAKLDEAKKILKALGLPPAQQTDIAAYTLLALDEGPRYAAQRHGVDL
jgi:BsuBI/PstI restriction endonuclease HTH domain